MRDHPLLASSFQSGGHGSSPADMCRTCSAIGVHHQWGVCRELPQDMAAIFGPAVGHVQQHACSTCRRRRQTGICADCHASYGWMGTGSPSPGLQLSVSGAHSLAWLSQLPLPGQRARQSRRQLRLFPDLGPFVSGTGLQPGCSSCPSMQAAQPSAQLQHSQGFCLHRGHTPGLDRTGLGHPSHARALRLWEYLLHPTASATGAQHLAASRAAHAGARAAHADARAALG